MSPHMDDVSGTLTGIDYSDFEYQQIVAKHDMEPNTPPAQNVGSTVKHTVEPLEGRGGLSTNEVAELVYLETQASIFFRRASDDNVGARSDNVQFQGVVGANLAGDATQLPDNSPIEGTTEEVDTIDTTTINSEVKTTVDDSIFQLFEATAGQNARVPSDATVNDTTGASSYTSDDFHNERPYRNLTGRGPVLDNNDDITVLSEIFPGEELDKRVVGTVRIHAIYDIAEVDDAGRAFSVPDGM